MIGNAAPAGPASALPPAGALLLLAGAVALGLPGWLAYAGRWRRWWTGSYGAAFPFFPFGLAWMGAGAVLVALFSLLAALGQVAADLAAIAFGLPGVVAFCCGLAFAARTPRRLQPAWYRESRDRERVGHERRKGL
ncbi:MAG TPA: hypothetical protein VFV73_18790 [Streptosporangiaceae bacterium]|nr:hypothetical protein [Streptosporangiaceae bacterium]